MKYIAYCRKSTDEKERQVLSIDAQVSELEEFAKREKLKIKEEIEKIKTDGSSWLEPFREWIGSALSCAKIARAKNTSEDLAIFAKTVGRTSAFSGAKNAKILKNFFL